MTEKRKSQPDKWQDSLVSPICTHHVLTGEPMYNNRFDEVLPFHSPGLAPVKMDGKWFHIRPDGCPAYDQRYTRTFGYYEGRAAVQLGNEWFHIRDDGGQAYQRRFNWCGNFQNGLCAVREGDGRYHHILSDGEDAYPERYKYAGDFREGSAVVRRFDGLCIHIDKKGIPVHERTYPDLDVFHKGFSRARDEKGWFHIDRKGMPIYQNRFKEIEPFYNGQALCKDLTGRLVIIDENGTEKQEIVDRSSLTTGIGPKIMIIGTLGAGKTTFAKYISHKMGLPYISIDDCRQLYSDGTFAGEYRAWTEFISVCVSPGGTVFEFSGGGPHVYAVKGALLSSGRPVYVFWLDPPLNLCIQRASGRVQNVPAPYEWGDVDRSAVEIHKGVERSWEMEWTSNSKIHFFRLTMMSEKTVEEQFNAIMGFMDGEDDEDVENS